MEKIDIFFNADLQQVMATTEQGAYELFNEDIILNPTAPGVWADATDEGLFMLRQKKFNVINC